MKREQKEKILVLVYGGEDSLRMVDIGYEAARELDGELYILHVEKGNSMDLRHMASLQEVAERGGRLGGTVCFGCGDDVEAYVRDFARQKNITGILVEPLKKGRKKPNLTAWMGKLSELLPPEIRLLPEQEYAVG